LKLQLDPRNSKFLGLASIAAGLIISFATIFHIAGVFSILYGTACLLIPHILFPTEEEAIVRAEKMRRSTIKSRSQSMHWYRSPVFILPCIGLLAYGVYALT
jgi:hypothetical protein